jgi:hypothetical protein
LSFRLGDCGRAYLEDVVLVHFCVVLHSLSFLRVGFFLSFPVHTCEVFFFLEFFEFLVVYFCRLRRLPSSPLLAEICWKNRELFKVFFVFLFLPLLLLLLVFFLLSPLLSFPTTHLDCDLLYIEVWNFGVRVISQCCEASSKGWESEGKRSGRMVGMAAARELLYSATDHFFTHFDFQVLMNGEPCPRAWPLSCFPSFPENLSAYRVISST